MRNPIAVYPTDLCLSRWCCADRVGRSLRASDHYMQSPKRTSPAPMWAPAPLTWVHPSISGQTFSIRPATLLSTNFVNHEFWYNLQGNSTAYWVEVGAQGWCDQRR